MIRSTEELDADENIINFQNGVLHLDTMELTEHTPDLLSTIQIPCDWNPFAASTPVFDNFMSNLAQLIDNEDEKISQGEIERWFLLNYCKMMSKNIFKPVEDCSAELEYKPFQTLAKYFEEQGYVGIKYKSTVFDEANNIVIFDKSFAQPCGEILDYYISD